MELTMRKVTDGAPSRLAYARPDTLSREEEAQIDALRRYFTPARPIRNTDKNERTSEHSPNRAVTSGKPFANATPRVSLTGRKRRAADRYRASRSSPFRGRRVVPTSHDFIKEQKRDFGAKVQLV